MPDAPTCLVCGATDADTPLVRLEYRGQALHICPRELPVLIHDPKRLTGILPGAENLDPSEGHDHHPR